MVEITTIGLDIGKSVFQVHGVDSAARVAVRRQLRRAELVKFFGGLPQCLIGMEACSTSHYWARRIGAPEAALCPTQSRWSRVAGDSPGALAVQH